MDGTVLQTSLLGITDHASVTHGLDKFFFSTVSKPTLKLALQPLHFLMQWTVGG